MYMVYRVCLWRIRKGGREGDRVVRVVRVYGIWVFCLLCVCSLSLSLSAWWQCVSVFFVLR